MSHLVAGHHRVQQEWFCTDRLALPPQRDLSVRCLFSLSHFILALVMVCATVAQSVTPPYRPRQVLKTPMRAITDPMIIQLSAATVPLNELVLGVTTQGEARAYRINELTEPQREVINDHLLGGMPIAAAW
jgi:hypothetical protein